MREHARVLAVDDSATQLEELRLVLESAGFEVATARDGRAALERLAQPPPVDLVISDVLMPEVTGYELCRRIKDDVRWRHVPVLLLTSLRDPVEVMHALECGADSFMGKPYNHDRLIARVGAVLEARRHRADGGAPDPAVIFRGERFTVPSDRPQILDLLISTFEDVVLKNQELLAAQDELAAKHEALLRAERQKEEFGALLVHDLKSPAAGIMMAAETRLRSAAVEGIERQLWSHVFVAAELIARMVQNLLDISRSEDGVMTLRRAPVDVPKVVATVQQLMTPLAGSRRQQIAVDARPDVPAVEADPELLRRVLQNLVDNAIRHSPPGSTVRIEAGSSDGFLCLRVRDEGPGVPVELRERIFDKYVRAARPRGEDEAFGKGLGLAFCRMAIEAHGGDIRVEDNQPTGSVFVARIPIS
jgi:signal transduction histidine kinase